MNEAGKVLLVIAVVALLTGLIADCAGGRSEQHLAVIVGRVYKPADTDVGVGIGADGNVITTITEVPACWQLVLRDEHGVRAVDVRMEVWAAARVDLVVPVSSRVGRWTGTRWCERVAGWPQPASPEAP